MAPKKKCSRRGRRSSSSSGSETSSRKRRDARKRRGAITSKNSSRRDRACSIAKRRCKTSKAPRKPRKKSRKTRAGKSQGRQASERPQTGKSCSGSMSKSKSTTKSSCKENSVPSSPPKEEDGKGGESILDSCALGGATINESPKKTDHPSPQGPKNPDCSNKKPPKFGKHELFPKTVDPFLLFLQDFVLEKRKKNPSVHAADVAIEASEVWTRLSDQEKNKFGVNSPSNDSA